MPGHRKPGSNGRRVVMPELDAPRQDALALLADARAVVLRRFGNASAEQVDAVRNALLDGRVATVAVGEFKRGKSSLLGALLEDPDLFPAEVDIATSLVTSVEHGPVEQILVYQGGGSAGAPTSIARAQLADYVTERGNPLNAREIGLVRIAVPNPRLEPGLVFLDTPGAGG